MPMALSCSSSTGRSVRYSDIGTQRLPFFLGPLIASSRDRRDASSRGSNRRVMTVAAGCARPAAGSARHVAGIGRNASRLRFAGRRAVLRTLDNSPGSQISRHGEQSYTRTVSDHPVPIVFGERPQAHRTTQGIPWLWDRRGQNHGTSDRARARTPAPAVRRHLWAALRDIRRPLKLC